MLRTFPKRPPVDASQSEQWISCCKLVAFLAYEGWHPCRLSKIRVSVGKALKARHVPKLEFRLNQLSEAQAAVEEALDRLRTQDT